MARHRGQSQHPLNNDYRSSADSRRIETVICTVYWLHAKAGHGGGHYLMRRQLIGTKTKWEVCPSEYNNTQDTGISLCASVH